MSAHHALSVLAGPISNGPGPGTFLRILVAVALVGVVVLAVLLLRGYRD
jgi:hypothetical protein